MTVAPVDAKKGWCPQCRAGGHALCASVRCICPQRGHNLRPTPKPLDRPDRKERPMTTAARNLKPVREPSRPTGPPTFVFEREDPPAKEPRGGLVAGVAAHLEDHYDEMAAGEWMAILDYGELRPRAAATTAGLLRRRIEIADIEFSAGRGRVYARRAGK